MSVKTLLRGTCDIQRRTQRSDGAMGQQWDWLPLHQNVPCTIQPAGASEGFREGRDASKSSFNIYIEHLDGLRASDQVVSKGLRYKITGPPENMADRDKLDRLSAERTDVD